MDRSPSQEGITCIYCKQPRPRPSRGEHIVLESLGGRQTIQDVCADCNGQFGRTIDLALARSSLVPLDKMLTHGVPAAELKVPVFLPSPIDGTLLDGCVYGGLTGVELRPQIYFSEGMFRMIAGTVAGYDLLREAILDRSSDWVENAKPAVDPRPEASTPRLVAVRERKRLHPYIRAQTIEDVERFRGQVREALPRLRQALLRGTAPESFTADASAGFVRLSVKANDAPRCGAKMAFNFLCYYLGSEVALRDEFDPVRGYIRGDDVLPDESIVTPEGEQGLQVDTRFVENWLKEPVSTIALEPFDRGHSIYLGAQRLNIHVSVALFGRVTFRVSLGVLQGGVELRRSLPAVFFTPVDGAGDSVLTTEDYLRAYQGGDLLRRR